MLCLRLSQSLHLLTWIPLLLFSRSVASNSFLTPWTVALSGFSTHRISQASILEWAAISFSSIVKSRLAFSQIKCDQLIKGVSESGKPSQWLVTDFYLGKFFLFEVCKVPSHVHLWEGGFSSLSDKAAGSLRVSSPWRGQVEMKEKYFSLLTEV